jgi:transposase
MKPYIRIQLSEKELAEITKLYESGKKHHLRQKSQALLFSHSGKIVTEIGSLLDHKEETIRRWFKSWKQLGTAGFEIKKGRGLKSKLMDSDDEIVKIVKKK